MIYIELDNYYNLIFETSSINKIQKKVFFVRNVIVYFLH